MKKRILALVTAVIMLFAMVGCSNEGMALLANMKQIETWEALEMNGSFGVEITFGGETLPIKASFEGYMLQDPMQAELTLSFDEFSFPGDTQILNLPSMTLYMNGMQIYLDTAFYKELAALEGADVEAELSHLIDLSKDYIVLDMTSTLSQSGFDVSDFKSLNAQSYQMLESMDISVPIQKEGNAYTISLDDSQLIDIIFDFYKATLNSPEYISQLTETYQLMGLSDEDIQMALTQVNSMFTEETKALFAPYLSGSKAQATYTFNSDSYDVNLDLNLDISLFGENISLKLTEAVTAKKASPKVIHFPTNIATYDYMEWMMSMINTSMSPIIEVSSENALLQENTLYVPFRQVLNAAGLEVGYDQASQTTFIVLDKAYPIETLLINGTSYISLETAAELGITVSIIE